MGPELAAEAGTALYLPMTGCNDRVEGFGSLRAQRHVRTTLGGAVVGMRDVRWCGVSGGFVGGAGRAWTRRSR